MNKKLVATLIAQHNELRAQMGQLDVLAISAPTAAAESIKALGIFKRALEAHLLLENKEFYPVLLEKFKDNKTETNNIRKFIKEMAEIEKTVLFFFDRYKDQYSITSDSDLYRRDLGVMINTLMIRISSEEDGIYLYW